MALCTVCRIFCIRFCNAKCALHDRQNPQVLIQSVATARPRAYEACTFTKIAPANSQKNKIYWKLNVSHKKVHADT